MKPLRCYSIQYFFGDSERHGISDRFIIYKKTWKSSLPLAAYLEIRLLYQGGLGQIQIFDIKTLDSKIKGDYRSNPLAGFDSRAFHRF